MNESQMMQALRSGEGPFTPDYTYAYVFDFEGVAQGEEQQRSVSVDLGTGFLCTEIAATARFNSTTTPTGLTTNAKLIRDVTAQADPAAAAAVLADIGMVDLKITQTDRPWMSDFVPLDQISGDSANPYVLTNPILITQKTDVNAIIRNNLPTLTGAASPAIDVKLTLIGVKVRSNRR